MTFARIPFLYIYMYMPFHSWWRCFSMKRCKSAGGKTHSILLWPKRGKNTCTKTRPWYANWDNAPLYLVENSWRPDHTNAEYPRLTVSSVSHSNNAQQSDFWKRNGAYLRLKNVTLGYTLPKAWINKMGLSNIRVYANGTNLLTFTDFKYIDPESTNVATGYYPQQRTFSFGIDVRF